LSLLSAALLASCDASVAQPDLYPDSGLPDLGSAAADAVTDEGLISDGVAEMSPDWSDLDSSTIEVGRDMGFTDPSALLANQVKMFLDSQVVGGRTGFLLVALPVDPEGSPQVVVEVEADTPFYPASTIKVLQHVHAMLEVASGAVDLDASVVDVYSGSESCEDDHMSHMSTTESLRVSLRAMMEESDNQRSNAIQEFFGEGVAGAGRNAMNDTARQVLGLTADTWLHQKYACGGVDAVPPNSATLRDYATLYHRVGDDLFDAETWATFSDLMTQSRGTSLDAVIDEEAVDLRTFPAFKDDFKAGIESIAKGGSFTKPGRIYRSLAGRISVPLGLPDGSRQDYVYGVFVDQAESIADGFSVYEVRAELLRGVIRSALETY
jgi:hypothetical protein